MIALSADAPYRAFSRRLSWVVTGVFALLSGALVLLLLVVTVRMDALGLKTVWRLAFAWAPTAFYLWTLWGLRRVFVAMADSGLVFTSALGAAVSAMGWGLLLGGGATISTLPVILAISPAHGAAGFVVASFPALTVCGVGGALIAFAALVRKGLALQAEAANLQAELREFF